MDSSDSFYQLQQQAGAYSSLPAQSTLGVAALHEWNPSLHLNNDEYNRYMNEILPSSVELLTKKANFPDEGCHEHEIRCPSASSIQNAVDEDLNENLWAFFPERHLQYSTKTSWACPDASSYVSNNVNSNLGSSTSSLESTHLATYFTSNYLDNYGTNCASSSRENLSVSSHSQLTSSYKVSECRNETTSRTKRVCKPSQGRQPNVEATAKKQRAASQTSCSLPKVGKEKIGDRIAALHRLVAPFGKTDAASVLTEAIGYIQFLQHQIQTLSMPCIKSSQSDRHRCIQLVKKLAEGKQDLRSRGLCLVPVSIASYISSSCSGLDAI